MDVHEYHVEALLLDHPDGLPAVARSPYVLVLKHEFAERKTVVAVLGHQDIQGVGLSVLSGALLILNPRVRRKVESDRAVSGGVAHHLRRSSHRAQALSSDHYGQFERDLFGIMEQGLIRI